MLGFSAISQVPVSALPGNYGTNINSVSCTFNTGLLFPFWILGEGYITGSISSIRSWNVRPMDIDEYVICRSQSKRIKLSNE